MGKLPDFDNWKRPWTEGEINEERLARLVYNLKLDVQERDEKIEEKAVELTTLTSELDTVKASKASPDPEVQDELKALRAENRTLKAGSDAPRPQDQLQIDRLEVALELGLSKADAKRLVGSSREELLEDAKVFAADHGIEIAGDDDGDELGQGGSTGAFPSQRPRSALKTTFERSGAVITTNPSSAIKTLDNVPL